MNVLILTASTGGGHIRASNALKSYFKEKDNAINVNVVDTFKYINPLLDKTVTNGYLYLAKKTPKLYGKLYKLSNDKPMMNNYVNRMNSIFAKKLIPLIEEFKPQIILTTHPFSTEMIAYLKDKKKINVPLICIMTDYGPHNAWIRDNVNEYIVSNDDMMKEMIKSGVGKDKIHSFGIPIENDFYDDKKNSIYMNDVNLNHHKKVVLMMAGSFGVKNILGIYEDIIDIDYDFELIIVTGRNKKLYEKFQEKVALSEKDVKLIYFTEEIVKYMKCADMIITKPGGLTVTEALACNIPLVIFDAIPGQEEENADFLVKNNMAIRLSSDDKSIRNTIEVLLTNDEKLKTMKKACIAFDKSKSCENIFSLIKEIK